MLKKLLALALAGAMVLGSMSAIAAPGDAEFDSKLVISGLAKDDQVNFYHVLEWEPAGKENAVVPNSQGGWIYTQNFIQMSSATYGSVDRETIAAGVDADVAGKLAQIAAGIATPDLTATANASGIAEATPTKAGMYVAIITPSDVNTVYNPVIVSADYNPENGSASWIVASSHSYADTAAAKKSTLEIKKSASTVETAPDDVKSETTAVGDTVTFTVNTTIPGYGEVYTNPTFVMKDTLTDLKLVSGSVAVEGMTDGVEYDLEEDPNGLWYTITFKPSYLNTVDEPKAITVTYDALVTTDALNNMNVETNEVEIKYSHNPSDTTGQDVLAKKDTTQHYTFTIDANNLYNNEEAIGKSGSEIVKIGLDADGKPVMSRSTWSYVTTTASQPSPLAGAKFKLYRDKDCTIEYKPKTKEGVEYDMPEIVSDVNGRLLISGLDAGKYWLKEISAPAGYIKAQEAVEIEIIAVTKPQKITEYYKVDDGEIVWAEDKANDNSYTPFTYDTEILDYYEVWVDHQKSAKHTFINESKNNDIIWLSSDPEKTLETPASIVNRLGLELPSTGGIGTTIFYMGGAVLVLLAGVLLVSKRRIA